MNKNFTIRAAGLQNDSIVDGPGLRFVVFTQGCPHNCEDCHNPRSHDVNGGFDVSMWEILSQIDANPLLDGVTFSGGEPLLQANQLYELAKEIKARGLHIMMYSGYTWEEIMQNYDEYKELLSRVDILVDGRFVKEEKSYDLIYKGSRNQRLINVAESLEKGTAVCTRLS